MSKEGQFGSVKGLGLTVAGGDGVRRMAPVRAWRILRGLGYRFKQPVVHVNESDEVKEARIMFYEQYLEVVDSRDWLTVYFDWSAFGVGSFKRRLWGRTGQRTTISGRYEYSKLHLLVVIGPGREVLFQLVQGTIRAPVIFSFFKKAIETLKTRHCDGRRRVCVVLDNSNMNSNSSMINVALSLNAMLLFCAPNSSFSNPIEQFFAYVKSPLKTKFVATKYP